MKRLLHGITALVTVIFLAACTQVYTGSAPTGGGPPGPPSSSGPSGGGPGDEDEDPFEEWDEVLEDTEAIEGYFKTHLKRDNTLFMEIPTDRLDEEFGLIMHFSRGVGVFNAHDGLRLGGTQLMRFERRGDEVYLVRVNPRLTAEPGSAMETSLEENVGHSVVRAFEIESQHEETEALLIDLTDLVVSDYARVGTQLEFYFGENRVRFDADRSHVDRVRGFPQNVELDAFLTFSATQPPRFGSSAGVSDWRSVPIGVRYSIFKLPDEPMQRRLADDRVGYFLSAVRDFSRDKEDSPYIRYVNRWRLEKKDHDAELSEPVEPIVYYIDRSVPEEYRPFVKEGIENWNKAFEAAGYRNAVVAKVAPTEEEDSTWSAEDIRYSTVRWSAAHSMGYAIGPSQVDPRTGEILNADILISSTFVTGYKNDWEQLAGPEGMLSRFERTDELRRFLPEELARDVCVYEMGKSHQIGFQRLALTALGEIPATEPMPEEFLGASIADLVMHEVGHTLGLRHNMKGSSAIPFERLDEESYTRENGLTLSVMDYAAVNINPDRSTQGHYVNTEVGSYDVWAIRYGYQPVYQATTGTDGDLPATGSPVPSPEKEREGLQQIAGRSAENLHTYGTDEDVGFGGWGVDPNTNTWDLSDDPLSWARQRARLVAMVKPQMEDRVVSEGEAYADLRGAVNGLLFDRYVSLSPLTKVPGGLYFHRDHRGQPGQRPTFEPVTAQRQREAVNFLIQEAFAPGAWSFEAELLNRMAPNRYSDWSTNVFGSFPVDYPVHRQVRAIQGLLLGSLLNNARLARMIDNEVRMPGGGEAYTLAELMETLTEAIWRELGDAPEAPRNADSFQRNLQRVLLDRYAGILLSEGSSAAPEDARSLARHELKELARRIDRALEMESDLDAVNRAHLDESRARIRRALEASISYPLD